MITPPKKSQKEVSLAEQERIARMNADAYKHIKAVQAYVLAALPSLVKLSGSGAAREINKIIDVIVKEYGDMFNGIRGGIIDAINQSLLEQRYLVERAVGVASFATATKVATIPNTQAYAITRKVLSERSILRRDKVLAGRVAKIVKLGVEAGQPIRKIAKAVDIELGLKNSKGRSNFKDIVKMRNGTAAHANGHFYQAYRIARTEGMRMASIQSQEVFEDVFKDRDDVRLQMVARIDSRTRSQSVSMNGQLANEKGEFKYPNGRFYKHGFAPARWSINDRETTIPVFLEGDKAVSPHVSLDKFKRK